MTDHSVAKTNRRRRPEARPAEILAAALALFTEKGFSATRMEDISSRAGLSKAAIYLYFDDKVALLQALVKDTVGNNLALARGMAKGHEGPIAPLLTTLLRFIAGRVTGSRLPDMLKLVISESRAHPSIGHFYLENIILQGLPFFEGLIRRGIETGEFRSVDPVFTVRTMVAPILLASIWKSVFEPLGGETLDVEGFFDHTAEFLLRGLRP